MRVHVFKVDYSYCGSLSGYEFTVDSRSGNIRFSRLEEIASKVFNVACGAKMIEIDYNPPAPILWNGMGGVQHCVPLTQDEQEIFWKTFKEIIIDRYGFDDI